MILPLRCDPDCVQLSVNLPEYAPLYFPDHLPDSPPLAVVVVVGAVVVLAGAAGVLLLLLLLLLPQPTAIAATIESTNVSSTRGDCGGIALPFL